jgi:wyosine [tRNA(Phe)-imidazoG37] synthetase (radical SAM superfamily)
MLRKRAEACHVYGPVPSRRLGFSLGVDILPYKTCSFDCIYCQLGRTPRKSNRRARYFSSREILSQIRSGIARNPHLERITFSGSGEPTLNTEIGGLIRKIKKMTDIPIVVLTNSSLLTRRSVRRALLAADIVVPSLDAATAASFRRVNRPLPSVKPAAIIKGLVLFRREFAGRIWLEVMLVKGVNDSAADIRALKKAVDRIRPDKVQLNTVVRPPAEKWARPLSTAELNRIRKKLGDRAEVIAPSRGRRSFAGARNLRKGILAIAGRRPVTLADLTAALGRPQSEVRPHLETLLRWHRIGRQRHKGYVYYSAEGPASGKKGRAPEMPGKGGRGRGSR